LDTFKTDIIVKNSIVLVCILLICCCSPSSEYQKRHDPKSAGMSSEKMELVFKPLQHAVDSGHIGAAVGLIARNGQLIFLESTGMLGENIKMRNDAICRMASIGKTITAAAIMKLYERDLLDIHDPVSDYLPEYSEVKVRSGLRSPELIPPENQMTIFHLLTHQSGLASKGNEFWNVWDEAKNVREFASMIAALPLEFQPGEGFRYGQMGSSYEVLAAVAEVVAHKRFDMILQEEILDPLQMNDTYFHVPESKRHRLSAVYVMGEDGSLSKFRNAGEEEIPSEFFAGGGALRSTVTDFYRFIQCLLNDGEYEGRKILSPSSVELMTSNQVAGGAWNPDTGWGLGAAIQMNNDPPGSIGSFGWNGGTGTMYMANKKQQWISIIFIPSQPRTPHVKELRNQFIQSSFEAISVMKD